MCIRLKFGGVNLPWESSPEGEISYKKYHLCGVAFPTQVKVNGPVWNRFF